MNARTVTAAAIAAMATGCLVSAVAGCAQPGRSAAPAAAPASVDTHIEVYADCTSPTIKPASMTVTCADAGWSLTDLAWTSWTSSSATATGTLVYNDCTPSCAAGHFHRVAGTRVLLTDPRESVSGQLVWTRLQETPWPRGYETGPLHGEPFPLPIRPV